MDPHEPFWSSPDFSAQTYTARPVMANGGGFQENLSGPAFLSEPDPYLCFDGDVTMFDVPAEEGGSMLDTGGIHYDICANPLPMLPSDVSADATYADAVLAIPAPAFTSTQEVDNIAEVGIQSRLPPPNIADPEPGDVNVQEAPVAQVHPELPDETIEDTNTTGLIFPVRTRYATAEDWEHHRAMFTRLYLDEKKTLKEVKSIMKDKYGFIATWVSPTLIRLAIYS
jgi:hypothetical protein